MPSPRLSPIASPRGRFPPPQADDLVIVCGVFIHPAAEDNAKILKYNHEATKLAIQRAMKKLAGHCRDHRTEGQGRAPVRQVSVVKAGSVMNAGRRERPAPRRRPSRSRPPWSRAMPRETTTIMPANKPTILVQLDTDAQPSVFDAVVAVDAGVEHLFRHGGVTPDNVRDLVYGALFTRGPADLNHTAIFIGGSNVPAGEAILEVIKKTFFGPFRVSVLFDANGSNTTAAAAVLTALQASGGSLQGHARAGPGGHRSGRPEDRSAARPSGSHRRHRLARPGTRQAPWPAGCTRPRAPGSCHSTMTDPDSLVGELQAASVVINSGPPGVQILPALLGRSSRTSRP